MNPSAIGWIDKFHFLLKENEIAYSDFTSLYVDLKKHGFVYGINVAIPEFIITEHISSEDEKAKINLLTALYYTYYIEKRDNNFDNFIKHALLFYQSLETSNTSFFSSLIKEKKISHQLEKIINSRIYIDDNIISKNLNYTINSLLFVDILAFRKYLINALDIKYQAQRIESFIINMIQQTLELKNETSDSKKLAQLFYSSVTYLEENNFTSGNSYDKINSNFSSIEKQYFLDIFCLTIWEENMFKKIDSRLLFYTKNNLNFSKKTTQNSLEEIAFFITQNFDKIPHLKDSNFTIKLYEGLSKKVNKLILRNSKRLKKELNESKELVSLISKSTMKNLTVEERDKVQKQLLDIFKTIPSLAIFILPGGAILLPIFIKLIPKLLPSAFDDNRID